MFALPSEVYVLADRWSILNNNRTARQEPDLANYYALLAALDAGWEVEAPVYLRADWSLARNDSMVFHFVLVWRSRRMTTLLSVPDCDLVQRLISDNNWKINPPQ